MEHGFGEFLKAKRQEKNLTQKQLANTLFVSESAVSKWEKDVAHPDISLLPKLAEILGVTEHELITATVDEQSREERAQAKKWRKLSFTWNMFFYIAYAAALLPCFICNLAIEKTLSWFWIVASALLLAFTFTNLPRLIKRNKLLWIPLSAFAALCILLAVCAAYTHGDWFWIAVFPVFVGAVTVFLPVYICRYPIFSKIRKYNDFICVAVDFVLLNALLILLNGYTVANNYTAVSWYAKIALPVAAGVYLLVNLLLCVRFLKVNRLVKTGLILAIIDLVLYLPPPFLRVGSAKVQKKIDAANVFKADFSSWKIDVLANNVHCIICLTILFLAVLFLTAGICRRLRQKDKA